MILKVKSMYSENESTFPLNSEEDFKKVMEKYHLPQDILVEASSPEEAAENIAADLSRDHMDAWIEKDKAGKSWYVILEIDDLQNLMDHESSQTVISTVLKFVGKVAAKHKAQIAIQGDGQTGIKIMGTFDTVERARGFIDDVSTLKTKLETTDHVHNISFNIGLGKTTEEAEKRLDASRKTRESGEQQLHYATSDEEQPPEELQKAYGDEPEDKKKILTQLFRNHMLTSSYLKQIQADHTALPPAASEMQKLRSSLRVERATASHAHTKKYLEGAIGQYHPGEPMDTVQGRLFEQYLNTDKDIADLTSSKLVPPVTPNERSDDEEPQGDLHGFLQEQGFVKAKKGKKKRWGYGKFGKSEDFTKQPGEYKFKNLADLKSHLEGGTFSIISPHASSRQPHENEQHHNAFLEDLKTGGHSWTKMQGMFGTPEPSYMIHNMKPQDSVALAQKYDQFSHIFSNKNRHSYIAHKPHDLPSQKVKGYSLGEFPDYFTEVPFHEGGSAKFRFPFSEKPTKLLSFQKLMGVLGRKQS